MMHIDRHSSSAQNTFRIQRWIVLVGFGLLIVKFAAYYITQSVAILTDALESIVNVVAGSITLYSLYIASIPRDASHPYGHGKAEFLSAAVEGTLIILAALWMYYEAIEKLFHPRQVTQLQTGVVLVAIGGAINYVAGRIALSTGRQTYSLAITSTGKHLISDAISTLGLVAGLVLIYLTNYWWIDSAVAMVFATIILITGIGIVRKSVAGIMDEADTMLLNKLLVRLNKHRPPSWIDLHNVRIIKHGTNLHIDGHMTLPWYFNINQAHQELDSLQQLIQHEFGDAIEMFVHTDGCMPFSCPLCSMPDCPVRQHAYQQRLEWTLQNIFENKKLGAF